jgi:hypothetical protein
LNDFMKILYTIVRRGADLVLSPVTFFSALWFKFIRSGTVKSMPVSNAIFMYIGVLPIRDHYYQPMINAGKHLRKPLGEDRDLPGIDWNEKEQLRILDKLNYSQELDAFANEKSSDGSFRFGYDNPSIAQGDANYLYAMIRHSKPKKVIEVGCGHSTLLSLEAERKNKTDNPSDTCEHICIEPFEMPWLEKLGVTVHRKKVEEVDLPFFSQLSAGDILFIDSSHMIRPQGDVLFEFLQILPTLNSGVVIHVHDIFSPKDYPKEWIVDDHIFWNEQYLLEAFLSCNDQFKILGAVNYLKHHHTELFHQKFPASARIKDDEPGSFWFIKK